MKPSSKANTCWEIKVPKSNSGIILRGTFWCFFWEVIKGIGF